MGDALSDVETLSNEAQELDESERSELAVSQSLVHYSPSRHETDGANISVFINEQDINGQQATFDYGLEHRSTMANEGERLPVAPPALFSFETRTKPLATCIIKWWFVPSLRLSAYDWVCTKGNVCEPSKDIATMYVCKRTIVDPEDSCGTLRTICRRRVLQSLPIIWNRKMSSRSWRVSINQTSPVV